jgi:multidrug efflux system membrane fusion protein
VNEDSEGLKRKQLGRRIFVGVVLATAIGLIIVILETHFHPRTDDASVRANFIEIAPEVSGRLVQLPVRDNAFVKAGDLLFVIDPRDYEYALNQALSDRDNLEQRIVDTKRKIAAENSAVEAANIAVHNSSTGISTANSEVDQAKATVSRAQAAVTAAEAQLKYATNDLGRLEPLLTKQYVTVDQVDQARTAVRVASGNYDAAQAALSEARARLTQATLHQQEADDALSESRAKLGQSIHVVDTLDILKSERPGLTAKVDRARVDLERCGLSTARVGIAMNRRICTANSSGTGSNTARVEARRLWFSDDLAVADRGMVRLLSSNPRARRHVPCQRPVGDLSALSAKSPASTSELPPK